MDNNEILLKTIEKENKLLIQKYNRLKNEYKQFEEKYNELKEQNEKILCEKNSIKEQLDSILNSRSYKAMKKIKKIFGR